MNLQDTYNKFSNQNKDLDLDTKSGLGFSNETIILFAAFFVSCAIMFYGAAPVYKEAKIIKLTNEIKTEDIKVGELLLTKIVRINNENKEINNEEVKKVGELIPNRDNYEDYLAYLASLANNKNIKINSFFVTENEKSKEENEEENGALNKTIIDISATGFFLNFMSFTRDIENGIPFICEKSVSISKSQSDDDDSEILDYEMNMEFYHY
ncbi:MAG: hypothetical protein U9N04_03590 [Patescibacteria group bacterium]|nr:hypothetical protein [Patescibacteria group bacterium]